VKARGIRGVLLDVDGVLRVDDTPIPGAAETIAWLERAGLAVRFLTNTSVRSRASLAANLRRLGLPIETDGLFTAASATASYLREVGARRIYLLVKGNVVDDFAAFEQADSEVDAVVIGGAEENFTYERMNRAFRLIDEGAELVAIHRNTWWMTERGPWLDAGAYVAALETATGRQATLIGKPAPRFFELALASMGVPPPNVLVVGDDVGSEVAGGHAVGCRTALVQTGKFRPTDLEKAAIMPDVVLPSIAALPSYLGS
jgi:HAD superfamily hydrolase (TIGR01458 family)